MTVKLEIDKAGLLQACKEIIETILFCLPNAYKGTVYRIGNPPDLVAKQVTSGVINEERTQISWGIPEKSRYAPPGKPWTEYRDEPGRPPEAMAWCVEKQKSWTDEDPRTDERNARAQQENDQTDFHHMEPVLISKYDLYLGNKSDLEYPVNHNGESIWQDSNYIVVDVIKIHFRPNTIRINSPETKVIKKLSRVLGTELLSHQFRQQSVGAMRQLAEDKQQSCNILADSIRNAITKSGFIFSLIKLELAFLREQWEGVLLQHSGKGAIKQEAVFALNTALSVMGKEDSDLGKDLIVAQNAFLETFLPPERGEHWILMQIEGKWKELLSTASLAKEQKAEIHHYIRALKTSLYLGKDPVMLRNHPTMPEALKSRWVELLYRETDRLDFQYLEELIQILKEPGLNLPCQSKSRKTIIRLKALAEIMAQLEQNTNVVLSQVLKAHDNGIISNVLTG